MDLSNYLIPICIIWLGVVVYAVYMVVFYPKFKKKYEEANQKIEAEWWDKKDWLLKEYFSNPDKFGMISDLIKGEEVIGMITWTMPVSSTKQVFSAVLDALPLSKEIDMSHYYLVLTDKGLHYMWFDWEKCFIDELFEQVYITNQVMKKKSFSFDYKEQKIKFDVEGPWLIGYPRFEVHEWYNANWGNYFVREYFAYENTDNLAFKQYDSTLPKFNMWGLDVSHEQIIDQKVRDCLVEEFRKKLWVTDY